jgi:formyltetrahydrofolate synthetase
MVALREPSMGPVFGIKGGAAGGGYAQVVPMTDINLNFTGDFASIAAANNLLSALIDNHIHHGNALGIDPRTITWKRVVDLNDRALRDIVVSLGGVANGFPREDGFDIVVASEVMAIFCLATSLADLKERLGNIVIGYTRDKKPVTARDLKANGAMTVILRDALAPNLVQTLEHTPAMIHGGPFANIAHGCNSVMATRTALKLADYVVTEAGFGADLGAEKFIDIKCRTSGLRPSAVVVVATIRALKYHGGVALADLKTEDVDALTRGMENLRKHLRNVKDVYGLPPVVAINRFPTDTDAEVAALIDLVRAEGARAYEATHFSDGGAGAEALAHGVLEAIEAGEGVMQFVYADELSLADKAEAIATKVYGAAAVTFDSKAAKRARADRGRRLLRPAGLHGQDAELVLHRRHPARRPDRAHRQHPRGPPGGRRGLRRHGDRRHHDDARAAQGAGIRPHRHRRERQHRRPQLRGLAQIRCATSAVHPVWCDAPQPRPVSPSKYSANVDVDVPERPARVVARACRAGARPRRDGTATRAFAPGRRPPPPGLGCAPTRWGTRPRRLPPAARGVAAQPVDEQHVDREPHRPTPVRVATEEAGGRLPRVVGHRHRHPGHVERHPAAVGG